MPKPELTDSILLSPFFLRFWNPVDLLKEALYSDSEASGFRIWSLHFGLRIQWIAYPYSVDSDPDHSPAKIEMTGSKAERRERTVESSEYSYATRWA